MRTQRLKHLKFFWSNKPEAGARKKLSNRAEKEEAYPF